MGCLPTTGSFMASVALSIRRLPAPGLQKPSGAQITCLIAFVAVFFIIAVRKQSRRLSTLGMSTKGLKFKARSSARENAKFCFIPPTKAHFRRAEVA